MVRGDLADKQCGVIDGLLPSDRGDESRPAI
jgi:hypothetical protein